MLLYRCILYTEKHYEVAGGVSESVYGLCNTIHNYVRIYRLDLILASNKASNMKSINTKKHYVQP